MRELAPLLRHLLRPTRGGAAAVVGVFAVLLTLAAHAGLFGLPLACILLSWFFKYGYILFDHVVRGVDEPPVLDIKMLNPLDEQRPLAQLAILGVCVAAVGFTAARSAWLALPLGILLAVLFPASVAVLGLEGNVFKAVYPPALTRLIAGLGLLYAAVLGVIAAAAALLAALLALGVWPLLLLAVAMFATLGVFSALAGALYERRHDLGLETWHSPERTAAKQHATALAQDLTVVMEAYARVRLQAHTAAWAMLQRWLAARGHVPEDYRWLRDQVLAWPDPRYATRLSEEYVDRLLAAKRTGEALDAVKERVRVDPAFRPKTAAATLAIARLAVQGGGAPALARALLADFPARFHGDPAVDAARTLARHLGE